MATDIIVTAPANPDAVAASVRQGLTKNPGRTPVKRSKVAGDEKQYYQIMHGGVGQWSQGTIITSDDLAGIDVDRLLGLGAIAETAAPVDVTPATEEAPPAE